jgi:hypothetical protein
MTTLKPSPSTESPRLEDPTRLTRRSLWMIPTFVVVYFVTSFVGLYVIFPLLGLNEGDVFLFAHNPAGWITAVVGWVLLAAAPVAGVWLATLALRRGARSGAWLAMIANAIVTLFVVYMVFDEIRMAYFPQFTFPFSG